MKRKIIRITSIMAGTLVLLLIGGLIYILTALPDVGPAPDLKVEMSASQIERGKYLATHVAVCMDCHSKKDGSRFGGPMVPGSLGGGGEKFSPEKGFPGTYYAKNITPYALKNWTDGEIYRAITAGVSKKGEALFPVMPYHNYGQMDDRDIHAIIAYLRSTPEVKNEVPASKSDFPMNVIIRTFPAKGKPQKRPDEGNVLVYGKYLTIAASCEECHTQMQQGKPLPNMGFAGGREFPTLNGILYSPNITPDPETGIGRWTESIFIQRFKIYADSAYHTPVVEQDGYNSPMPWLMYAGMKESDLQAIYAYLQSIPAVKNEVVRFKQNNSTEVLAK